MEDTMKHIARTFLAIVLLTAAVNSYAQEEGAAATTASNPIGLSFGVDYTSMYLWRGGYWYGGDGAFFPSVSYEIAGLSIGYAGEYSEDAWTGKDTEVSNPNIEDLHAADFGIDYSYSIDKLMTIGAGVWYYHFYNEDTYSFYTGTLSVSLDSVPLTPTIAYNHDYYVDSGDSSDYYITLGISKSIEAKDAEVSCGITAGYYNADSTDQKGFSDVTASLGVSGTVGAVTLSGSFNWVYVPGKDFYEATIVTGTKDKNRTYANFGASYSL
jgi:uncharacterized protein YfiM (DUF2279 family)